MPLSSTNLSLGNTKYSLYGKITPYNWYNVMQLTQQLGSYVAVSAGSDPLVQYRMMDASVTSANNTFFQQRRIQESSFRLGFQLFSANSNGLSSFKIFFGYEHLEPYENTDNASGFHIMFLGGSNTASLFDYTGTQVASGTTSGLINTSTWVNVTIIYYRSTTNTWRLQVNGTTIFTYSDPNNPKWSSQISSNLWGLQARTNTSVGADWYIRGLQLDYIADYNFAVALNTDNSASNMIFHRSNWYNYFTVFGTLVSSAFSTVDSQWQIANNGTSATDIGGYASLAVHTFSSFTLNAEIFYNSTGATGDYLSFFFGSSSTNGGVYSNVGQWSVSFVTWTGYTNNGFSGAGVYLHFNGTAMAKDSSDTSFINSNTYQPVSIIYTRGTYNTWIVMFNGRDVLTYSDANNATFVANGNPYFGFNKHNGGNSESTWVRRLQMDYIPYSFSISSLVDGGRLGSGLTSFTSGNNMSLSYFKGVDKTLIDGLAVYENLAGGYGSDDPLYTQRVTAYFVCRTTNTTSLTNVTNNWQVANGSSINFTLEIFGYFRANITGTWTFYSASDDYSYVWIGPSALSGWIASNALISNGGVHGTTTVSNTISMTAGVYYPLRIVYGQASGGYELQFSFTPPSGTQTYNGLGYYFSSNGSNERLYRTIGMKVDMSNLIFWVDAQNSSSYTLSGSNVTAWRDLSGNGNNLANVTSTPVYGANLINNMPGMNFGNPASMSASFNFNGGNITIAAVVTITSSIQQWGCLISHGTRDFEFSVRRVNATNYFNLNSNAANDMSSCTYIAGNTYIIMGTMTSGTSRTCSLNSATTLTSGTGTNTSSFSTGTKTLYIGSSDQASGTSEFFNGYIGEIMYFQRTLAAYEQTCLIAALKAKWKLPPVITQSGIVTGQLDRITPDAKTACRGAYSLIRLSRAYTGPTINVRRSSDNATLDFYADVQGNLGTTVNAGGTTFASWLSGTAFLTTWYDQSGSGNHATQATTSLQPVLTVVQTGYVVDTLNSSTLFLNMPSGTLPVGTLNAPYSFVTKHGSINNTTNGGIFSGGIASNSQANNLRLNAGTSYYNYWYLNDYQIVGNYAPGNILSLTYDGQYQVGYFNNTVYSTVAHSGYTNSAGQQYIGKSVVNEYLNGQLYYLYIFGSAIPKADINILSQ